MEIVGNGRSALGKPLRTHNASLAQMINKTQMRKMSGCISELHFPWARKRAERAPYGKENNTTQCLVETLVSTTIAKVLVYVCISEREAVQLRKRTAKVECLLKKVLLWTGTPNNQNTNGKSGWLLRSPDFASSQ